MKRVKGETNAECGVRNAELKTTAGGTGAAAPSVIPHSALRIPHLFHLSPPFAPFAPFTVI
jgi:hypothetical protein